MLLHMIYYLGIQHEKKTASCNIQAIIWPTDSVSSSSAILCFYGWILSLSVRVCTLQVLPTCNTSCFIDILVWCFWTLSICRCNGKKLGQKWKGKIIFLKSVFLKKKKTLVSRVNSQVWTKTANDLLFIYTPGERWESRDREQSVLGRNVVWKEKKNRNWSKKCPGSSLIVHKRACQTESLLPDSSRLEWEESVTL